MCVLVTAQGGESPPLGCGRGQGRAGAGGPHDGRGADPHHPRGRHHRRGRGLGKIYPLFLTRIIS